MDNNRSRWEIIREMLVIIQAEDKVKKTRIMHKAYIDWNNFNKHLEFLINEKFIDLTEEKNYILTNEGKELLDKLDDVNRVLNKS